MKVGSFHHLSASFNIFHGLKGHFPNLGGKFYSSRYATFPGPETQDTLIYLSHSIPRYRSGCHVFQSWISRWTSWFFHNCWKLCALSAGTLCPVLPAGVQFHSSAYHTLSRIYLKLHLHPIFIISSCKPFIISSWWRKFCIFNQVAADLFLSLNWIQWMSLFSDWIPHSFSIFLVWMVIFLESFFLTTEKWI